jgi:hypothetical protein
MIGAMIKTFGRNAGWHLLLLAAAIALLGTGPGLAQANVPNVTMPPASTTAGTPSMPPAGRPGSALGAIQTNLANQLGTGVTGRISTCTADGFPSGTQNFPVDETDVTAAPSPAFSASEVSVGCAPPAPAPGPGLVAAPAFDNGAVPLDATEAGGLGLSPLIAEPAQAPASPPETSGATCDTATTLPQSAGATTVITSVPLGC